MAQAVADGSIYSELFMLIKNQSISQNLIKKFT